jgi:hypothetical protein
VGCAFLDLVSVVFRALTDCENLDHCSVLRSQAFTLGVALAVQDDWRRDWMPKPKLPPLPPRDPDPQDPYPDPVEPNPDEPGPDVNNPEIDPERDPKPLRLKEGE